MVTSEDTKLAIAVSSYENRELSGIIHFPAEERYVPVASTCELLTAMEALYDSHAFPMATTVNRSFKRRKAVRDRKLGNSMKEQFEQAGKAKFIIHVQFRQNATWQGTIQWVEKGLTQRFRSTFEMLKLMDEALGPEAEGSVCFIDADTAQH